MSALCQVVNRVWDWLWLSKHCSHHVQNILITQGQKRNTRVFVKTESSNGEQQCPGNSTDRDVKEQLATAGDIIRRRQLGTHNSARAPLVHGQRACDGARCRYSNSSSSSRLIWVNLGPVPPHTQISTCWNGVASWVFQSCCSATPAWPIRCGSELVAERAGCEPRARSADKLPELKVQQNRKHANLLCARTYCLVCPRGL